MCHVAHEYVTNEQLDVYEQRMALNYVDCNNNTHLHTLISSPDASSVGKKKSSKVSELLHSPWGKNGSTADC